MSNEPEGGRAFQVMSGRLLASKDDPGVLTIEGVKMRMPPLLAKDRNLRLSQKFKGLPPQIFISVQRRIKEIAKASGFRVLRTGGAQNYAVAVLYEKFVHMIPEKESYQNTLNYLAYVLKSLNSSGVQGRLSLDQFARALGDVENEPANFEAAKKAWSVFRSEGTLPMGFEIIRDAQGKEVAMLNRRSEEPQLFIIDSADPNGSLLSWKSLYDQGLIGMTSNLRTSPD